MTAWELRLGKADWDRHERGDEWFVYDDEHLYDSTPDELDELEQAMDGYRIFRFLDEWTQLGAQALRAALWIARRRAGIVEPWAKFQPQIMRLDSRRAEASGDAVPPGPSSPPSSTGDEPATSPSTSDRDSPSTTRGSRRRTSAR